MAMQCEMLYYFSSLMAGLFTHQSVYSYISHCSWRMLKSLLTSSISYGEIMTSQCCQ